MRLLVFRIVNAGKGVDHDAPICEEAGRRTSAPKLPFPSSNVIPTNRASRD